MPQLRFRNILKRNRNFFYLAFYARKVSFSARAVTQLLRNIYLLKQFFNNIKKKLFGDYTTDRCTVLEMRVWRLTEKGRRKRILSSRKNNIRKLPLINLLVMVALHHSIVEGAQEKVLLGGIFPSEINGSLELEAFRMAIDFINNETAILPSTELVPIINKTDFTNAFDNVMAAYWQIYHGAIALVGPLTSDSVKAAQIICSGFRIPQIAPYATEASFSFSPSTYPFLVRMSASDTLENRVLADLVTYFNWSRMAIITSRSDYGLNGLVVFKDIASHNRWDVVAVESFQGYENVSKINATTQLRHIRGRGARVVILHCIAPYIPVVLQQAGNLGMLKHWVWIVDNGAFSFNGIYNSNSDVPEYMQGLIGIRHAFGEGELVDILKKLWIEAGHDPIMLENVAAIGHTFDSVILVANALHNMFNDGINVTNSTVPFGFCSDQSQQIFYSAESGEDLFEYILKVNTSGAMNNLAFSAEGSPLVDKFDIVNLRSFGFSKVGSWNGKERLVMDKKKEIIWPSGAVAVPSDSPFSLENQTLTIVTLEESPFVMARKGPEGNLKYEGYCIDLLTKLCEKLNFDYKLYLVPDGQFGAQDILNGEWNGMVKEIINGKADIALASFTISPARQNVIDFTQPFIDLGLTILMKTTKTDQAVFFSFLKPFTNTLWLLIALSSIFVAFLLWFFSTFSPYGFYGRSVQTPFHKAPKDYLKRRHALRLTNALWSSLVYYVGQSADALHPVSASGRLTVAMYWFAIIIILSTYTANLAAVLTIRSFNSPISGVEDLARQKEILYGTVKNSQPEAFFMTSPIPSFVTMYQFMKYHKTMVQDSEEGILKVKQGGYAFIWDSVVLEHVVHTSECGTLTTVGKLFGKIGYGLGLPKDSLYTKQISTVILELRHKGYTDFLEQKWLRSHGGCNQRVNDNGEAGSQITITDMAGVFFLILAGSGLSFIVLLLEWLWSSYVDTKAKNNDKKISLMTALKTRFFKTWHDWNQREDVPELPRYLAGLVRKSLPTAYSAIRKNEWKRLSILRKKAAKIDSVDETEEDLANSGIQSSSS